MRSTDADLRTVVYDGALYLAADDVAALLLDLAQTAEQHPELSTATVFREVARGLAAYEPGGRP
ncbi:hypothetical protein [Geodermatophilus chilensis]|uniref:hypothetical protein n=1 Tax=Geodermatophilus chilensis TaxID=2035835 RepID=UPI000C266716|nr:hypothetical protein [Geodermatophilus chilensis]